MLVNLMKYNKNHGKTNKFARYLLTRGQSSVTKGRIAVRTNRASVYNDKTLNLNGVKFTRLAHH